MQKREIIPNFRDYDQTYQDFSWESWHKEFSWHKNSKVNYAYEITNYQVEKGNGNKPAVIAQKIDGTIQQITFKELADVTDILAANFKNRGLLAGDRFALYAPRSIEYVIVLQAALKCGAIAVPLFEAFGADAIEDRLKDCSAAWIYTTEKLLANVPFSKINSLKSLLINSSVVILEAQVFLLSDLLQGKADPTAVHFGDL